MSLEYNFEGSIHVNEEQKIEQLLEEYKNFFETTTADITKSAKGRRFFFFTDRICGDLYCLAEFTTADELEQIILHELTNQINIKLQNVMEHINHEIKYIDISYSSGDLSKAVNQLAITLDVIQKELCKYFPEILTSLQGISNYIKKHEKSQT